MKAARSPQKRRRAYRASGFHGMERALSRRGLSALDGRSAAARAIAGWKADVEADLAGDLTTAERTLLEAAAGDLALLTYADAWLREHSETVINRRRRAFPLVAERLRVASHLAELLKAPGLKRRARPVPSLAEYLAASAAEPEAEAEPEAPPLSDGEGESGIGGGS